MTTTYTESLKYIALMFWDKEQKQRSLSTYLWQHTLSQGRVIKMFSKVTRKDDLTYRRDDPTICKRL